MVDIDNTKQLSLAELKTQSPSDLLKLAEKLEKHRSHAPTKSKQLFKFVFATFWLALELVIFDLKIGFLFKTVHVHHRECPKSQNLIEKR